MSKIARISLMTIQELIFEKVFYLLFGFSAAAIGLSAALGQMTYGEVGKVTLDFMLAGTQISMTLFSIFMSISLIHRDISSGSISMILSKPVPRGSYLIGKFLGQNIVQGAIIIAMGGITLLVVHQYNESLAGVAVFQCVLLIMLETLVISAMTYFFAVNGGAIVSAMGAGLLFLLGHFNSAIQTGVRKTASEPGWHAIKQFVPDLEIFNLKSLAAHAQAIPSHEVLLASGYALICVTLFMLASIVCFSNKDIAT